MSSPPKKISNPYSSSGAGAFFESYVQASFVTLMLCEGMCPALEGCRIDKVKLQSRHLGHQVDDVLVFTTHLLTGAEARLLGQIKADPAITIGDDQFKDTIHAAWRDYNDPLLFTEGIDALALITGHLSVVDTDHVRELLEWARGAENANDFFDKVAQSNFSSDHKRRKLEAFQHHLRSANGGVDPSLEQQWGFLKSFHLLGYDLDISAGVLQAILQTLVGNSTSKDPEHVWLKIVNLVQRRSPTAGTFTWENLPGLLKPLFKRHQRPGPPPLSDEEPGDSPPDPTSPVPAGPVGGSTVPEEPTETTTGAPVAPPSRPLPQAPAVPMPIELAIGFVAGWEENVAGDMDALSFLTQESPAKWQRVAREIWDGGAGPLDQVDARWKLRDQKAYLSGKGAMASDGQLQSFKDLAIAVLSEYNPAFEVPKSEWLQFPLKTPQPKYSYRLRAGISETLALLGSDPNLLPTCSTGWPTRVVNDIVKAVLDTADWRIWSTLNQFLPLLAEASPDQYLKAVEDLVLEEPKTVQELIAQEGGGMFGTSHITGMLWGLELVAWSPEYFNRSIRILASLAAIDPGGTFANRPANSLATILLPWLPQTSAESDQRFAVVRNIVRDHSEVAWKLLLDLLPEAVTTSSLSHKPKWRDWLRPGWDKGVTGAQYWKDSTVYSLLALEQATADPKRLAILIARYFKLPHEARAKLQLTLTSTPVRALPDNERHELWLELVKLTALRRRFRDSPQWHISEDVLNTLDAVADQLKPTAPEVRHQRLFSGDEYSIVEDHENWEEQRKLIEQYRAAAVKEILDAGGLPLLTSFAESVQGAWHVGFTLGSMNGSDHDRSVLPAFLESESEPLRQMAGGYALAKVKKDGWAWVETNDLSAWSTRTTALMLAHLPFRKEAWDLAAKLLGKEEYEYWGLVQAHPYDDLENIQIALQKLVDHDRADEALMCMFKMMVGDKGVPVSIAVEALRKVRPGRRLGGYELGKVIGMVQSDPSVDPSIVRGIEWKFLSALGGPGSPKPTMLSRGLAEDPAFFSEVIRAMYRSSKEAPSTEEPSPEKRAIALNAYTLLREWDITPGTAADGTFDAATFTRWLSEVKQSTTDSGHLSSALYQIGEVVYHSPIDEITGLWPAAVCEALDVPEHDRMREGLRIEIFNSRGVHSSSGGAGERALALKWNNVALEADKKGYTNLATTLRALAKSYEDDAVREAKRDLDI